ncbi:ATP-binding protein [Paenibacillus sp. sgz302251]|uniref:ATP-binding protein n=1 Tax=Paenibacillus sp. sgz302251 TaxID=3414493 RepID=UPI003C79E6BC
MNFYTTFFTNMSILITFAYLFNLVFKSLLQKLSLSPVVRDGMLIVIFIFSGWLAMKFGVQMREGPVFDLRAVPIIFATLLFRDPRHVFIIGLGIAVSRLGVNGLTANSFTGSLNIAMLGVIATGLVLLYRRKKEWSFRRKATISLLLINTAQAAGIVLFGAIPREMYITHVLPYTFPLAVLLGAFFLFIIRDFYQEQLRVEELKTKNELLLRQRQELLEAKQELENKTHQLMQASQYKSEFMANMSHELRTPLNSIILLSQLIREHENDGRQSETFQYADIIHNSSTELLQIINDILDLSKVEAGKMEIEWGNVSIEDITQMLYYQIAPLAAKKDLSFEVIVGAEVPKLMVSDGLRLSQILRNLLSNAVKFTVRGSIALHVSVEQSSGWIVFAVRDTGIGIEQDMHQLIFDAFHQEDGTLKRKYEGTGLGLTISKKLAKLLGGTISLRSKKGEGSEFLLRLPLHPQQNVKEQSNDEDRERMFQDLV